MATLDYLPVGCFGKLPCYPDYLDLNVSYPTSTAFRQWLRGGHQVLRDTSEGEDGEITIGGRSRRPRAETPRPAPEAVAVEAPVVPAPTETASVRVLLGLPGSVELLAAVVRPSADLGHRRAFPFALFTHVPRRIYGRHYALLPLGLAPVWDALDDAFDNLAATQTRDAFDEVFPALLAPVPLPLSEARARAERLRGESTGAIFERDDGDRLDALRAGLPATIEAVRRQARARLEFPVRGGLDEACQDASFWIELVNRQFFWKRHEPAVFLDERSGTRSRHALLAFGPLDLTDYGLVMRGEGSALRPARQAVPGATGGSPDAADVSYGELLSISRAT